MSFLARNFQRGCRICISIGHFLRKCFFLKILNFFKNFRTLSDIFLLKKNQAWITSPVSTSLGRIVKGAFYESRGPVWTKAKNEKQLEVLWFFPIFREILYTFEQNLLYRWFRNCFSRVQKIFLMIFGGELFFFFSISGPWLKDFCILFKKFQHERNIFGRLAEVFWQARQNGFSCVHSDIYKSAE